jgi:hypothetical protein
MAPLDDAFLRIDRADEHLADLKEAIDRYLKAHPNAFVVRVEGMTVSPMAMPSKPPPRTTGILIGEFAQNLRTALDYLAFQLAWFDSGPSAERRTQFLIEDRPKGFKDRKRFLEGLSPTHVAMIERLQPYNGAKWLAILRDISNTDKHNVLDVLSGAQSTGMIAVGLSDAEAKALGGFRRPGDKVGMYYKFPPVIMFRNKMPVLQILELLKSETRALLETFKPEFKGWEIKTPPVQMAARWGVQGPLPKTWK